MNTEKMSKSFNQIKGVLALQENEENRIIQLKSSPQIEKNQIWLCEKDYYDALGNRITSEIPFIVVIVNDVHAYAEQAVVRVQPISPFTEYEAEDDILITDDTIVGFNFIIETWNEQPILTSILSEYIGSIHPEANDIRRSKELSLNKDQKEFRKAEIVNTAYLRQSIISLLKYEENMEEAAIFLNIDHSIYYPKKESSAGNWIDEKTPSEVSYLLAAKKGNTKQRATYLFEREEDGKKIQIAIIKHNSKYIVSAIQPDIISLMDKEGNIKSQSSANLYDELESGLYILSMAGINKNISIVLK
jgi:hypothetical protein